MGGTKNLTSIWILCRILLLRVEKGQIYCPYYVKLNFSSNGTFLSRYGIGTCARRRRKTKKQLRLYLFHEEGMIEAEGLL